MLHCWNRSNNERAPRTQDSWEGSRGSIRVRGTWNRLQTEPEAGSLIGGYWKEQLCTLANRIIKVVPRCIEARCEGQHMHSQSAGRQARHMTVQAQHCLAEASLPGASVSNGAACLTGFSAGASVGAAAVLIGSASSCDASAIVGGT